MIGATLLRFLHLVLQLIQSALLSTGGNPHGIIVNYLGFWKPAFYAGKGEKLFNIMNVIRLWVPQDVGESGFRFGRRFQIGFSIVRRSVYSVQGSAWVDCAPLLARAPAGGVPRRGPIRWAYAYESAFSPSLRLRIDNPP